MSSRSLVAERFSFISTRIFFEQCYICDVNEELILSYRVIQKSVKKLISELETLESDYLSKNDKKREEFYYEIRDAFNQKLTGNQFQEIQFRMD